MLARAANRVGKTRHAAYAGARQAIDVPMSRIRVIAPTKNQANKVMGRYLAEFLQGHLDPRSYYTGRAWNNNTIMLRNGSLIELTSLEDDPQSQEGDEFDLIIFDEVPKVSHWGTNISRVGSRKGRILVVMTPVGRPVKWLRDIVEAPDSGWTQCVAEYSRANCPWYTAETVDEHLDNLRSSPWEWAQRVEGAWEGVSANRMLDGFTDDNVVTSDPTGTVDLGITFDHGVLAGKSVALFWAGRKGGAWSVYDEWISDRSLPPEEVARELDKVLARHGFRFQDVNWSVGDINVNGVTGRKINKELEEAIARMLRMRCPFRIEPADKSAGSIHYGIRVLNYAFSRYDIRIHARCVNLIDACKHWEGGKTGEDGMLSDRIDPLRYGAFKVHGGRKLYASLRFR